MNVMPPVSDQSSDVQLDEEAREIALRARTLEGIELTSVLLWEMKVTRGTAEDLTPGGIAESASYRVQREADSLWLEICSSFELTNSSDSNIANVEIAHLVGFAVPEDRQFNDDEAEVILSQARLAAYPFTRAKVLALSSDMGLQPIVMPLMRRSTMGPASRKD